MALALAAGRRGCAARLWRSAALLQRPLVRSASNSAAAGAPQSAAAAAAGAGAGAEAAPQRPYDPLTDAPEDLDYDFDAAFPIRASDPYADVRNQALPVDTWADTDLTDKVSTNVYGTPVVVNAREVLIAVYKRTLELCESELPPAAAYRTAVEKITKFRLGVVESTKNHAKIEDQIQIGQIEFILEHAKDELKALKLMSQEKPWEADAAHEIEFLDELKPVKNWQKIDVRV